MIPFAHKKSKKGQTIIELALFGSVLIFMIGVIVRTVMTSGYSQNQNYKAFRLAMTTSFMYSEGLVEGINPDGNASHNTASVVVIEDRLSASSAKYATMDRTPFIVGGSGTHSRNLFYPTDFGEHESLPVTDYFINGKHIPLTVAGFAQYNTSTNPADCGGPGGVNGPHTIVPNHPALPFDTLCVSCFDLDRSGGGLNASESAAFAIADDFGWQWQFVSPQQIRPGDGQNTQVDVDCDMKEETVLERNGLVVRVIDSQMGDIDPTLDDRDAGEPHGLTGQDALIYTYARNPAVGVDAGLGTGTYLQVDSGRLFSTNGIDRQFVRTAQQKDSLDVVQRIIRLNRNTGHFCSGPTTRTTSTDADWGWAWSAANPNPVEVCSRSIPGCFGGNADQTCMVTEGPEILIFVRSRIKDVHGRQWITDTHDDPTVDFNVPLPGD